MDNQSHVFRVEALAIAGERDVNVVDCYGSKIAGLNAPRNVSITVGV